MPAERRGALRADKWQGTVARVITREKHRKTAIIVGVLFMGFALAMVPVVMFPVFKKVNEVLALGCVVFRGALESVGYMATAAMWLLLVELSREHAEAASSGAPHFQTLGALLAGPTATYLTTIAFSLGSLMFYYLFYQSRLVPRWLSIWGLAGAVLYLATPLLDMFGHGLGILMAPLAVAEIVLAVWLIAKGFSAPALASVAATGEGAS